ncbi:MAG: hypothetical protein Q8Q74_17925 [Polaromonas sp.]|uniref:hypothetical protein n=1 Tax=Polaromonas sp. TaxID=1869339 RepID=UPI00273137ED|nr:hypothetical protein [Polaromonas sp.]MDP2448929.1 hypothetical protein [Polaromonas sp.]MDP3828434.1 hypothetical protein [Polaromonas sp.]
MQFISEIRTRIFHAAIFRGWLCAHRSRMRATNALNVARMNFHSNGGKLNVVGNAHASPDLNRELRWEKPEGVPGELSP